MLRNGRIRGGRRTWRRKKKDLQKRPLRRAWPEGKRDSSGEITQPGKKKAWTRGAVDRPARPGRPIPRRGVGSHGLLRVYEGEEKGENNRTKKEKREREKETEKETGGRGKKDQISRGDRAAHALRPRDHTIGALPYVRMSPGLGSSLSIAIEPPLLRRTKGAGSPFCASSARVLPSLLHPPLLGHSFDRPPPLLYFSPGDDSSHGRQKAQHPLHHGGPDGRPAAVLLRQGLPHQDPQPRPPGPRGRRLRKCLLQLAAVRPLALRHGHRPAALQDRRLRQRQRPARRHPHLRPLSAPRGLPHRARRQDALLRARPAARLRAAPDQRHLPGRLWLDRQLGRAGMSVSIPRESHGQKKN